MVPKEFGYRQPKKNLQPGQMNASTFSWFAYHTPNALLKKANIRRQAYTSVAQALAKYGDYETGEKVNPSKRTLHRMTGVHEATITKVLNLLVEIGALKQTGRHQGSNGGKPYAIYDFRREPGGFVDRTILAVEAKRFYLGEEVSPIPSGEDSNPSDEDSNPSGEDNRNVLNEHNALNGSVAEAPSLTPPSSLSPTGRAEERVDMSRFDEVIAKEWSSSEVDDLLSHLR